MTVHFPSSSSPSHTHTLDNAKRTNNTRHLFLSRPQNLRFMAKRPCCASDSHNLHQSPSPSSDVSKLDRNLDMDSILPKFLEVSDTSALSIDLSFEKLLESIESVMEQNLVIDRALMFGSALLEAGKRATRKRASVHNSIIWPLPPDLTVKIFSMLDTQSLCYATATCSMFSKCATNPMCYANIDLTTVVPKVNNAVVSTVIQRAGRVLQSLKLGIVPCPTMSAGSAEPLVVTIRNSVDAPGYSWKDKRSRQGKESSILTRSCLSSLSAESPAAGFLLRKLHLYNIERIDNMALCLALSACPSLLDLEIVGLYVELRQTLMSVSTNCHLIERFFFESSKTGRDDSLKLPTCTDFVNGCPNLSSLSLRGFKLQDHKVRILVKGFHKLKYVDFSTSYSITGSFLRNLGSGVAGGLLEVLILRECMHLKEVEVSRFLTAVLAGGFKLLRHLDISNREGLASEGDWYIDRCYRSSSLIPMKQLREERPDFYLLADFPLDGRFSDMEQMIESDLNSEISLPSPLSNTSESSYNSDQGSGNEDGRDTGYVIYEESSDDPDFLNF